MRIDTGEPARFDENEGQKTRWGLFRPPEHQPTQRRARGHRSYLAGAIVEILERRRKQAAFRDPGRTLGNFDFTFNLLDELADAVADGTRKGYIEVATVPLLILDDFGMQTSRTPPLRICWNRHAPLRTLQHAADVQPPPRK